MLVVTGAIYQTDVQLYIFTSSITGVKSGAQDLEAISNPFVKL